MVMPPERCGEGCASARHESRTPWLASADRATGSDILVRRPLRHARQSGGNGWDRSLAQKPRVIFGDARHTGVSLPGLYRYRRYPRTRGFRLAAPASAERLPVIAARSKGAQPGPGGGTEQTMEWPMHKRLRPQSVPSGFSRFGRPLRQPSRVPRRMDLERIWLFLLLWRLKPHQQQPPCRC